jgi:hypothetical protein
MTSKAEEMGGEIMKKGLVYLFIVSIIVLGVVFKKYQGYITYYCQKVILSPVELIQNYTNINLPKDTIINSIITKSTTDNSEILKAEITVSTSEMDKIFAYTQKDYDTSNISTRKLVENNITKDMVDYYIWMPSTVYKGIIYKTRTQRNVEFIVLKSADNKTTLYLYIDKLGWCCN